MCSLVLLSPFSPGSEQERSLMGNARGLCLNRSLRVLRHKIGHHGLRHKVLMFESYELNFLWHDMTRVNLHVGPVLFLEGVVSR